MTERSNEHLVAGEVEAITDKPGKVWLYLAAGLPPVKTCSQNQDDKCLKLFAARRSVF